MGSDFWTQRGEATARELKGRIEDGFKGRIW